MSQSVLGGAMLVAGTAIGAGMLALPLTVGLNGFAISSLIMFAVFGFMLATLFLLLEASLRYQKDDQAHIISLSGYYLGKYAKLASWICFLIVLMAACTAYLTAGGQAIDHMIQGLGLNTDNIASSFSISPDVFFMCSFFVVFITIILFKPHWLDQINIILMVCLIYSFVMMCLSTLGQAQPRYLTVLPKSTEFIMPSIPIVLMAFTSHIILPTMRQYINNNLQSLIKILLIGSLIPLACYIIWNSVILSVIPLDTLDNIHQQSGDALDNFIQILKGNTGDILYFLCQCFMFFALATSYLGASLSLTDFLKDGLNHIIPRHKHHVYLALTYLPPLLFALLFNQFVKILMLAGIMLTLLYGVFPILMVWVARYRHKTASQYVFPGGRPALIFLLIISILLLIIPTYLVLFPFIHQLLIGTS
ncbi:MAG: amino acid permease [Candidatus Comchoanobacterales bacterium]